MKDAVPAVLALLAANAPFMTAIGSRLFHDRSEQPGIYPDVIVYAITGSAEESLSGTSPPYRQRISVDVRAASASQVKTIAETHVLPILENYAGTVGQTVIQGCHPVSDVASYDDTAGVKSRVIDFRVIHNPA